MKSTLKFFLIFFITLFIIWVDLPEEIKDRYHLPKDIKIFSFKKEIKTFLGLDLKGGSHLVFDVSTNNIKKEDLEDAISSARDIIEKRVNFFGVSEPSVQTLKTGERYRIVVDLPGIEDVSSAVKLIGQTAQLVFKEEKIIKDEKLATPTAVFVNTPLTGKDVKKASVVFSQQDGKPQVSLSFTPDGGKLFAEITKRNISKPLAIFIDNILISAPVVQQEILDGNAVITGNFTVDQAKKLAIAINSGALPVTVNLIEQKNIGPTLGAFEVRKSVLAGIVGLFTVLLFMILYYGKLGLIASLALFIYGAISLAIFKIIPVVLTLPGVAGFILSIGMAVDSNILIFERMKEELRKGKSFEIAFNLGFGRAIDAIKDANITTLTVAFILFNPLSWEFLPQFGMVRGFALTLAIGVATSLFTGVVITKRLIKFFYKI
jgi:protein-export membrane protein SecD